MKLNKLLFFLGLLMATNLFAASVYQGHATLVVKKDKVEAFKIAAAKIISPTRKEEDCITYYGYQVIDEQGHATNRFEFHEIWTSKDAMLIKHKDESPHMKAFFKEIKAGTPDTFLESFEVGGKWVELLL